MPQFEAVPVTDARAQSLLSEYFSSRELSFPAAQGRYRPRFPDPLQFVPPAGVFVLVTANGAAVGCGGIRRLDDSPAGVRFEVKHLWLQPQTRGKGWGRALLDELEQRAIAFGAAELVLDTNKSLAAAAALYRSAGYADVPAFNNNPNATNWYRKSLPTFTENITENVT